MAVDRCPIFLQLLLQQMIRSNDYYKLLWHCVLSLRKDVLYSSKYTKISNNLSLFDDDKTLNYCNDITRPTNMYAIHDSTSTMKFIQLYYSLPSLSMQECNLYAWLMSEDMYHATLCFLPLWDANIYFLPLYQVQKWYVPWDLYDMQCFSFVMQNLSPFLTSSNNRNIWGLKFSWN